MHDRVKKTHKKIIKKYFPRSKIKAWIHHWKLGGTVKRPDKTRWEEDYELIEGEGLFDEYLEMGKLLAESGSPYNI